MDISVENVVAGGLKGYIAKWESVKYNGMEVRGEFCVTPEKAILSLLKNFADYKKGVNQELADVASFMNDIKSNFKLNMLRLNTELEKNPSGVLMVKDD